MTTNTRRSAKAACAQGKPEHIIQLPAGYPPGDLHHKRYRITEQCDPGRDKKCKVFPGDDSVWKVIYLAIKDVSKKWSMPIQHWRLAMSRFIIEVGDR